MDRDYYATRRTSRLRDTFTRWSPDRGAESSRSKYGYRRNDAEGYVGVESSYRDADKRKHVTRYRRYSPEDSYARQYNRIPSYSRRAHNNDDYAEYNTRSRYYSSKETPLDDSRYTTSSPRNNTTKHVSHRKTAHEDTISRRPATRWGEAVEDSKRLIPNTNLTMQLRYGGRRREDPEDVPQPYKTDAGDATVNSAERSMRSRVPSPRIAQMRAMTTRGVVETNQLNDTADAKVVTKTEITTIKPPNDSSLEAATVKEQNTAEEHTAVDNTTELRTDLDNENALPIPESPVKKKRGRPKVVKNTTIKTPPMSNDNAKDEKEKASKDPDQHATPDNTPSKKRASVRIRSNSSLISYSISTRHTNDAYEEQLKKAIALSIKEQTRAPQATTKSRNPAADSSTGGVTKAKQSSTGSPDDDIDNADYVPEISASHSNDATKKTRAKATAKSTTSKKTDKAPTKARGTKGIKESTVETPATESQQQTASVQPHDAVSIVNDGAGSAKMLFFEEYLDMSERMYCGKPLCVRQAHDESATSHHASNDHTTQAHRENTTDGAVDGIKHENIAVTNKSVNDAVTTASDSKKTAEQASEDTLFEFQCSNLDLRFRVSFAMLTSDVRQPQMLDLWGPKELVLFELGMFKHGKEFHEIQRNIPTKTVQEIVDMYYFWKKTNRYKLWKANRLY